MNDSNINPCRALPSVNRLIELTLQSPLSGSHTLGEIRRTVQIILQSERERVLSGEEETVIHHSLVEKVLSALDESSWKSSAQVINATGIILHTGLGRACLASAARDAIARAATGHILLEIDAVTGRRGDRQAETKELLRELTGCEEAHIVNNCAAAVFLSVTAIASGKEVIISRGQLVEIGGAFRMPDIIRSAGATLVEVGTTNKTRLSDYENAITERTGLILRCHPSNFAIVGFTEEVALSELMKLGDRYGIPVMDDEGSGALLNVPGVEHAAPQSVATGAIVTCSGDKLMGGPQSGIILGPLVLLEKITRHPLARAVRVDKLTLAALAATLKLYRDPDLAKIEVPVLRYLLRNEDELKRISEMIVRELKTTVLHNKIVVSTERSLSEVGGGSLPNTGLPTFCVTLTSMDESIPMHRFAELLRKSDPAIFGRIKKDVMYLDPRCVEMDEIPQMIEAINRCIIISTE